MDSLIIARFWAKVDKRGECWLWTANITRTFGVNGKSQMAHRVSWRIAHGAHPRAGFVVRQSCGNKFCVRPAHLFELSKSAATPTRSAVDRFWAKVDKSGKCWSWTGHTNNKGYGCFYASPDEYMLAHRFSYNLANGDLCCDLKVLHKCDTPACVRPTHLRQGTQLENLRDMSRKGRSGRAKLTEAQVRDILASHASARSLGRAYGVAHITILRVRNRATWRHVQLG